MLLFAPHVSLEPEQLLPNLVDVDACVRVVKIVKVSEILLRQFYPVLNVMVLVCETDRLPALLVRVPNVPQPHVVPSFLQGTLLFHLEVLSVLPLLYEKDLFLPLR